MMDMPATLSQYYIGDAVSRRIVGRKCHQRNVLEAPVFRLSHVKGTDAAVCRHSRSAAPSARTC